MKKLIAIVLAVTLLASLAGVALADKPPAAQDQGNGAPSGAHYNLNIIGVPHDKTATMTGTQGHTIFVPLKGRAKILLYESGVEEACGDKDFVVLDRNATDGPAMFCLPQPVETGGPCPSGETEYSYTVYARALGTPGGKSFTTTCYVDAGETYCSSITMKLVRETGKSKFQDVSKYLLFIYIEGTRYPLFADQFEEYFWRYDNNGLKLAQLRFYMNPTCVPDTAPYMSMVMDPACVEPGTQDVAVTITGATGADFTDVTKNDIVFFGDGGKETGITIDNSSIVDGELTLSFVIDIGSVTPGDYVIYITDANGETLNTTFTVESSCGE